MARNGTPRNYVHALELEAARGNFKIEKLTKTHSIPSPKARPHESCRQQLLLDRAEQPREDDVMLR